MARWPGGQANGEISRCPPVSLGATGRVFRNPGLEVSVESSHAADLASRFVSHPNPLPRRLSVKAYSLFVNMFILIVHSYCPSLS